MQLELSSKQLTSDEAPGVHQNTLQGSLTARGWCRLKAQVTLPWGSQVRWCTSLLQLHPLQKGAVRQIYPPWGLVHLNVTLKNFPVGSAPGITQQHRTDPTLKDPRIPPFSWSDLSTRCTADDPRLYLAQHTKHLGSAGISAFAPILLAISPSPIQCHIKLFMNEKTVFSINNLLLHQGDV